MSSPAPVRIRAARAFIFCALMTCVCQLTPAQVVNQNSKHGPDDATERLVSALVSSGSAAERRAVLASAPPGAVDGSLRETLAARGRAEREAKRFAQAAACFEAARSVAEFLKDGKGEAAALNELGETSVTQGEFERAVEFFERGRALDAASVNPLRLAAVSFTAGAVHFERGDYARALELYRRSLEGYERNGGSKSQISGVVYGIGAIHYLRGEYAEATEVHRRSMR
ncbi:MAG TPA: tetratricopeptide repeat protein, partial [Pyrinomonadaceae bacterium]